MTDMKPASPIERARRRAIAFLQRFESQNPPLASAPKPAAPKPAALEGEVKQLERIVRHALADAYGGDLLPPEELRLHVGASTTAANFWAQGMNSSKKTVEVFGTEPEGPVPDWGCGSGRTLNWLKVHPGWRKHWRGCDVDAGAIQWLRRKGFDQVAVCGDLPPLSYPGDSFAGLYAFSVLTHIPPENHEAWYAEIFRLLRPGGRALLTVQGDVVVSSGRVRNPEILDQFNTTGFAYEKHEGHYKDAALVSERFTRALVERRFTLESYVRGGYQNMDCFVLRKPG